MLRIQKKRYTNNKKFKKIYTCEVAVHMYRRSTLSTCLTIINYLKWLKRNAKVRFLTRKRFFIKCRRFIKFKDNFKYKPFNFKLLAFKKTKNISSTLYFKTQFRLLTRSYYNYFNILPVLIQYNTARPQFFNKYLNFQLKISRKFNSISSLIKLSKNKLNMYSKRSIFIAKYYPLFFYSKFKLLTSDYKPSFNSASYKFMNKYHKRFKFKKLINYNQGNTKTVKNRLLIQFYKRYKIMSTTKVRRYYKTLFYNKFFYSTNRKLLYLYLHVADKYNHNRLPLHKKFKLGYYAPRHINFKFLFKNQIREQHTLRWLYKITYTQMVKMFKKIVNFTKNKFEFMFFKHLEFRFDLCLYRLNFVASIKQARQWIQREKFHVNKKLINWSNYQVNIGDIIVPIDTLRLTFKLDYLTYKDGGYTYNSLRLYGRPLQKDQYMDYLIINERIPAALIFLNPSVNKIYSVKPWNIQFITSSLLKYS